MYGERRAYGRAIMPPMQIKGRNGLFGAGGGARARERKIRRLTQLEMTEPNRNDPFSGHFSLMQTWSETWSDSKTPSLSVIAVTRKTPATKRKETAKPLSDKDRSQ